jgi:hypothetical protein
LVSKDNSNAADSDDGVQFPEPVSQAANVETVAGSVFVVVMVVTPNRKNVDGVGVAVGSATVVVLRMIVVCVVVRVSISEYSRPVVVTVEVNRTTSTGAVYAN